MTLDAALVSSDAKTGVSVHRDRWIEQGRGYLLHLVEGYIALGLGTDHHGETPADAVTGLERKVRSEPGELPGRKATRLAGLAHLERRWGTAPVTLADSTEFGNCASGTRSWCRTVAIEPDAGVASLTQIIAAYRRAPRDEAWAVIRLVERRLRRAAANVRSDREPSSDAAITRAGHPLAMLVAAPAHRP